MIVDMTSKPCYCVPLAKAHALAHNIDWLVLQAHKGPIPVHHLAAVVGHVVSLTHVILPVKLLLWNAYHNITSHHNWASLVLLLLVAVNNLLELQQGLSTWNGHVAMCWPPDVVINTDVSLSSGDVLGKSMLWAVETQHVPHQQA
jgi:hypothetical protein